MTQLNIDTSAQTDVNAIQYISVNKNKILKIPQSSCKEGFVPPFLRGVGGLSINRKVLLLILLPIRLLL